jgi:hypothetical protein
VESLNNLFKRAQVQLLTFGFQQRAPCSFTASLDTRITGGWPA